MAKINVPNPIVDAIEGYVVEQKLRPYIGFSEIGGPCQRAIWYSFHWAYRRFIPPRVNRLFRRGDYEETVVAEDLKNAGMVIFDDQLELIGAYGHAMGHIDGKVTGIPHAEKTVHLLEVKTANDKNFKLVQKHGVKKGKWGYYVQVQMYMGYAKLDRCLHITTNKNDETRHYERIKFDQDTFDKYDGITLGVLMAEIPTARIGDKTWHECKFCNAYKICQLGEAPPKNCRTCKHGTIENNGVWSCGNTLEGNHLTVDEQRKGCQSWTALPALF